MDNDFQTELKLLLEKHGIIDTTEKVGLSRLVEYKVIDVPSDKILVTGYILTHYGIVEPANRFQNLDMLFLQGFWFLTQIEAALERDWRTLNIQILNTIKKLNEVDGFVPDFCSEQEKFNVVLHENNIENCIWSSMQMLPNTHYMSYKTWEKLLTIYTQEEIKFWITKAKK